MTPSGKHENKAYILHVALLRGNTSTAVTWVDGKFLADTGSSDKTIQMGNLSEKGYQKIGGIQNYLSNTFLPIKNKKDYWNSMFSSNTNQSKTGHNQNNPPTSANIKTAETLKRKYSKR